MTRCPAHGIRIQLTPSRAVNLFGATPQPDCRRIRKIPFAATDHEIAHGRDITWNLLAKEAPDHIKENWHGTSWIVEVFATGTRDSKPFKASHFFLTSLLTTSQALLQLVRERWSLESWYWIRDTQLHHAGTATAATVPA
jgi:hypothetical protein